jgi:putative resolvase
MTGRPAWTGRWHGGPRGQRTAGGQVVRVEAEAGSGMNGSRAKARRLLADPKVTAVVAGHRDRLGRMNTELAGSALAADGRRPVGARRR